MQAKTYSNPDFTISQGIRKAKYTRRNLVGQAVSWLVDWNYKAWRQSVGDPHPDDCLGENALEATYRYLAYKGEYGCALPYALRESANAHDALENIISSWWHGHDSDSPEVTRMVDYYSQLSNRGFNRLFNEVERKAESRLERKKDVYHARRIVKGVGHV